MERTYQQQPCDSSEPITERYSRRPTEDQPDAEGAAGQDSVRLYVQDSNISKKSKFVKFVKKVYLFHNLIPFNVFRILYDIYFRKAHFYRELRTD